MDPKVQEDMPEAICNYWLRNENTAVPGLVWDACKGWLRGEYTSRIANSQKQSVRSLEDLERELKIQEDNYVADPTPLNYGSWQYALWTVELHRIEMTKKSMLSTAQRVFEYRDKNGKLLAWLSRGQISTTHIGRIRDERGAPPGGS